MEVADSQKTLTGKLINL